ncbi:MAG: hypothetical protein FD171_1901 [Actinobacteria bacterium]|nr:MAG: hypothetical protein FD171_1901 [Actinomycetota bacterium]MDO8950143.1 hypothetical protein [Actinomycetota bacterium]
MDFTYKRVCHSGFESTVEAVERSIRSFGFVVERAHDLQATLAAKGFAIQPLRIYELSTMIHMNEAPGCSAKISQCRVHVYVEGEVVYVSAIRSAVLDGDFEVEDASAHGQLVEQQVVGLVDAATA